MVEMLEAPVDPSAPEGSAAAPPPIEHVLIDNTAAKYAKLLNEVYYHGQASQFGLWLPLDPSRIIKVAHPFRDPPRREDYGSSEEFEEARSGFADVLTYEEKNALSGVPLN